MRLFTLILIVASACNERGLEVTTDLGTPSDAAMGSSPDLGSPPGIGPLELVAGELGGFGNADGQGSDVRFEGDGLVAFIAGKLYVVDGASNVRRLSPMDHTVATFARSVDIDLGPPAFAVDDGLGGLVLGDAAMIVRLDLTTAQTSEIPYPIEPQLTQFNAVSGAPGHILGSSNLCSITDVDIVAGTSTTFAGSTTCGHDDGSLRDATFESISALAKGPDDVLWVTEMDGRVRRIDIAAAQVTTIPNVTLSSGRLVAGSRGLYAFGQETLQLLDETTGTLTLVAGQPGTGQSDGVDGAGTAAQISPSSVTFDGQHTLYFTDGCTVRTFDEVTGAVTTIAGALGSIGVKDGAGPAARFEQPMKVVIDEGSALVIDANRTFRAVDLASTAVTTVAGSSASQSSSKDGVGSAAVLEADALTVAGPLVYFFDESGRDGSGTVRTFDPSTEVVTTLAQVPPAKDCVAAIDGTIFFSTEYGTVSSFDPKNGDVSIVADGAQISTPIDGPLGTGSLSGPSSLALVGGTLYVGSATGIRAIDLASGILSTLEGFEHVVRPDCVSKDGPATVGSACAGATIAADGVGGVLFVDGNLIRRIDLATKAITTIVGTPGRVGVKLGALPASLNAPKDLRVSDAGDLYIIDETSLLRVRGLFAR